MPYIKAEKTKSCRGHLSHQLFVHCPSFVSLSVMDKGSCLRAILTSSTKTYPSIIDSLSRIDMPSSLPQSPTPYNDAFTRPDYSADYSTLASSSRDVGSPTSAPAPVRREPLAFAGIRHRMEEDEATKEGIEPRHSKGDILKG